MLNHYFAKPNISPGELIRKTIFLIVSIVLTIMLIGYLFGFFNNLPQPNQSGVTSNYYSVGGPAQHPYQTAASSNGTITYCPLDELSRPTCAYGVLTTESRLQAKERGRQDINVNPTGWPKKNRKVTIYSATYGRDDKPYYGWFWNRSHMVADSLGGDPVKENLVTGTRTQNVGIDNNHTGGMAYAETKARDYLDNPANAQCPLYYAVTPNYTNSELIPRTITIDMESCDQSISEHITVFNTANHWDINYHNGEIHDGGLKEELQ